jgi:MraZ protein
MFRGRSKHTLDDKGRLAIPARFKDTLNRKEESCLVVTNYINCLRAYAKEDWRIIEDKASKLSTMDNAVNTYLRYYIGGAQECELKQGRITLPPDLRNIAGLSKEVVLIGQLTMFEIWDKDLWEVEFGSAKDDFKIISQSLKDLGI